MSDNTLNTPSGKILFGIDYYNIMAGMEYPDDGKTESEKVSIIGAVTKFFLLQWGFSVHEIDSATKLFLEKAENNELEPKMDIVLDRLSTFVKDDREAQERLILQIVALALLDDRVSENEKFYGNYFKDKFDLRSSEFNALVEKGEDWCMSLDYIGNAYIEYSKAHE
jgi:hypothetical protein